MVIEEQHRRDDDVGASDVIAARFELVWRGVPIGSGVEADGDPRIFGVEPRLRALGDARKMIVERHNHDADGRALTGHSAPWLRRVCRG